MEATFLNIVSRVCGPGWAAGYVRRLPVDGSERRFARVTCGALSVVVVDSSREMEKIQSYVNVSRILRAHGFSAPEVYDVDYEAGYLVVEDLGMMTLGQRGAHDSAKRFHYCEKVIDMLPELQAIPEDACLERYSVERLLEELSICTTWHFRGLPSFREGHDRVACPRRADPGRMRVQRPEREEGLRDEETTYTRADRGKAA